MPNPLSERFQQWGFSWQGLRDNRHGEWWVLAQMVLILAHLLPPTPSPRQLDLLWPLGMRLAGLVIFVVGLMLAAQAALNLGANLTPLPEPMPGTALVKEGAYGRCRHPLYQALLLCSVGVTLALGSLLHLGLLMALAIVLVRKAHWEETRLCQLHPDYPTYRASTAAIFPFVPGLDWRSG
jgi:protein-S-isoprenylcysteine O-methyltransferase Ste14